MDVTMPDGTLIRGVPEGTTKSQLLAKYQKYQGLQSGPDEKKTDVLRQISLLGRAAAEGVVNTLALPIDMQTQIANTVRKAIFQHLGGIDIPDQPTLSGGLGQALDELGAYRPETEGEELASAITRSATSALAGGVPTGAAGIASALRPAASGAVGGGASEIVRQRGGGAGAQLAAGLVGGLAPGALENTVRGATRLTSNAIKPVTRGGQEQIAANVMADQAQDATAAAQNLRNAQPIVQGSARTAGEASQDLGLLALEKGVRGRNADDFAARASEQNAARQAELTRLGGKPQDIATDVATRKAATDPLRSQAFANAGAASTKPVHQAIDGILASPAGKREAVSSAMSWAKSRIGNETDPKALYEIRKDLQLAQRGKLQPSSANAPNASTLAQARGELGKIVEQLDDAIESAAPGFQAYLKRYADLSKPIDQKKVIQEIQRRAEGTGLDVKTGENFLGNANFSRALDKALSKDNKLTAAQVRDLETIRKDLQLGRSIDQLKAPGSDTFQNLSIAQAIGAGPQGAHPALRVLTKPLHWIYKLAGTDERVNEVLKDAMLDPKFAAQLLERATPAGIRRASNLLKRRLAASGLGAVISASTRVAETSEPQNTREK